LHILDRAKHLKLPRFHFLSRVSKTVSTVRETILQSKQMGKRENKVVNIDGRVQLDLLLILVRDYKLRSYTLNAVSYHFLKVTFQCDLYGLTNPRVHRSKRRTCTTA